MLRSIPLSALATARPTDETRKALADAGVLAFRGSEAEALAILALTLDDNPACHGVAYDATSVVCSGCVAAATCWRSDESYLRALTKGTVALPNHVPSDVVDRVLAGRRKPNKRPPKPRKRK